MKCFDQVHQRLKKSVWSPFENKFIESVLLPCGKCPACIERKIMEWSFRLDEERKDSECCYFVTLTYDNENVPLNQYGKMTLNKEHLTGFFKLLKQNKRRSFTKKAKANGKRYADWENHYYGSNLENSKIKYYAVGEYGTKRKRPHYHAIIFNTARTDIEKYWKYGSVDIQHPRGKEAMSYVAKYMYKRIYQEHPRGTTPEFSICSNGIGEGYTERMKKWYAKNIEILNTKNDVGIEIPMSKYIRNKLWDEETRKKQIPIVKINIEKEELKSIIKYGEDGHHQKVSESRKIYSIKIKRKTKPRKDT